MRVHRLASWALVLLAGQATIAPTATPQDRPDDDRPPLEQITDDGRWNQTDLGRYLASIMALPDGAVHKGLSVCVGDGADMSVCYDTQRLALRAVWHGGFLKFDPTRFGIINSPAIDGESLYSSAEYSGWQADELRYLGMYVHGDRVVLSYEVDGVRVLESPWASKGVGSLLSPRKKTPDSVCQLTRTFSIEPHERPLVLDATGEPEGRITIPPAAERRNLEVVYTFNVSDSVRSEPQIEWSDRLSIDIRALTEGGPRRWPQEVTTQGEVGEDDAAYVIDKITLPHENPYNALMFSSGHGFFSGDRGQGAGDRGRRSEVRRHEIDEQTPVDRQQPTINNQQPRPPDLALCTLHGEVWTVSGVDDDLDRLVWRRFATGLFQPLGMVVVGDVVHVLGRDQITRLHDTNGDGEADFYETFCSDYDTSLHGHDFVTSLERDAAGNFYFAHAVTGVMRVAPDGRTCESLASGLRNPNGLGASPSGFVTVAPQQGNWTPSSGIFWVRPGDWYGYEGLRVTPDRPLGYDVPLCWIPHPQDSSSGGDAWVTSDRWGPLAGQMIHFSYGQCTMMLTLREQVGGVSGERQAGSLSHGIVWQGGNVDFPLLFDSGAMRGRFSPRDGQLYVSGLRGWQNRAVLDGCLARVRYTGRPVDMPVAVRTMQNGLAVTFTRPLDRDDSQQVGNYAIQRWNYRFSKNYGSPDLRVDAPGEEGRDDVSVRSATLLDGMLGDGTLGKGGRTVFLEIPDMRPANQYLVRYALHAADGAAIEQEFSYTIHVVGPDRIDEALLHRAVPENLLPPEIADNLRSGIILRFEQTEGGRTLRDVRRARLAAWHVSADSPPTPRLAQGPFTATAEGYVQIRQPGRYRFSLSGTGNATLRIDGNELLTGQLTPQPGERAEVRLGSGHHRLEIAYESPPRGDASLRLWWSSDAFGREPVPPDVLHHQADDDELVAAGQHYLGRELFEIHRCASCHAVGNEATDHFAIAQAPALDAPDLHGAAGRLNEQWIAAWIEDPSALRSAATMPTLLFAEDERKRKQDAADLAAFVRSLPAREAESRSSALPGGTWERVEAGLADRGEILYEQFACLACHRVTPPAEADEHDRLSLHFVAAKYQTGGLTAFLRNPDRHFRSTRMPDFRLSDDEAAALAAYLRRETNADLGDPPLTSGDAKRGQTLYASLGCVNCHPVDGIENSPAPNLALAATNPTLGGCLATTVAGRGEAPAFGFTTEERQAVVSFLQSDVRSYGQMTPLESAARLVRQLRCTACHDRDGQFAPRTAIVFDEGITGLAPEAVPNLTWSGEKLRADWIAAFLAGRHESPRPWMKARMPGYPHYAEVIAAGLAAEHGIAWNAASEVVPADAPTVDAGRALTLETALDCRQCHGIGPIAPRGDDRTLSAPGINFVDTRSRVTHEFFLRLLRDPVRVDPATKMPKLAEAGRTRITQHFGGDAEKQFEAIWAYVQSLETADSESPLPPPRDHARITPPPPPGRGRGSGGGGD